MRSPLLPFPSAEAAIADRIAGPEYRNMADNPCCINLDGTWDFRLFDNPDKADAEACVGGWEHIRVPGTWTLQGYDKPHYTNVQMPFDLLPPHTPEHNPTGLYRRTFTLPDGWKNRRVVLHIGSAESCCIVYVNGVFAGAGKDTRLPQEYDITPLLRPGEENTLLLKVVRYSDASYLEDQDQWWFGGIHRSVYLYATAMSYIQDITVIPGLVFETGTSPGNSPPRTGSLKLAVTLGGDIPRSYSGGNTAVADGGAESPFTLSYSLYPLKMPRSAEDAQRYAAEMVQSRQPLVSGTIKIGCNYRRDSNSAEALISLRAPALWSAETPNLYILAVTLYRDGQALEHTSLCTGFRTVRVARRELLINEKAVLIKGVNRHEHDENNGKTLSVTGMVRDIHLLKQHHFNAVRTSHYPNDERWYELCDRYGIYLTDEANIEHHCFYDQLCRDTAWAGAYLARVQRMAERDKNHPSVIIWSLGNESGDGPNNTLCSAWIRRYDSSRPVHYEGAVRPEKGQGAFTLDTLCRGKGITDIIAPMYPEIQLITDFAKYRQDDRPLIMCEFSHGMGNSNGSLADYWRAIESNPGLQGGYIWDWIDQGIAACSASGEKYWKYGGDFGDEPTDYDFCLNGLLFPDQSPKPAMAECKHLFAPVRIQPVPGAPWKFAIENRYDFSAFDGLELQWRIGTETSELARGAIDLPPVESGGSVEVLVPAPELPPDNARIRYIHIDICQQKDRPWAAAGFVIASAEHILREHCPRMDIPGPVNPASLDFARRFKPSLFRVPTQNDGLKTYRHLRGDPSAAFYYQNKAMYPWLDMDLMGLRCVREKTETVQWEGFPSTRYTAVLMAGENAATEYQNAELGVYTCTIVSPAENRPLIMDIQFDLQPGLPELPKIGVTAKIPASYSRIQWFGSGPHESYPDRCAGAFLGRWEDTPQTLEVPYALPQENGNRMNVRHIRLSEPAAVPQSPPFTIVPLQPVHISASRYQQENVWKALHTCDLADVSAAQDGYYILNIDCAQRGVGTATCGPDTLEQYRVRPGFYAMRLYIY